MLHVHYQKVGLYSGSRTGLIVLLAMCGPIRQANTSIRGPRSRKGSKGLCSKGVRRATVQRGSARALRIIQVGNYLSNGGSGIGRGEGFDVGLDVGGIGTSTGSKDASEVSVTLPVIMLETPKLFKRALKSVSNKSERPASDA